MKGVILAGGLGKRLQPLTNPFNKHLLPVYNKPMIMWVIDTLVQGGIINILISLNGMHPGLFLEMLEDGSSLGCSLYFRYARSVCGPGRSLLLAEEWVNGEEFVVILGDSLFLSPLDFNGKKSPHMFVMPLNNFDDPKKYGQVKVGHERVTEIVWKPDCLFSNLIQTTCFIFPLDAFERLHILDRETRGEVHITALTSQYIQEGSMRYTLLPQKSYIDCGTADALLKAGCIIQSKKE